MLELIEVAFSTVLERVFWQAAELTFLGGINFVASLSLIPYHMLLWFKFMRCSNLMPLQLLGSVAIHVTVKNDIITPRCEDEYDERKTNGYFGLGCF